MSERTFATDCVYTYECEKENKTKQNETIDRQSTRYFSFEISFVFFFFVFNLFDLISSLLHWRVDCYLGGECQTCLARVCLSAKERHIIIIYI